MHKIGKMAMSLCAVTLAIGSADADVVLYQNYTPGTTDYNINEWRLLDNAVPVYVYDMFFPGKEMELSFNFTATTSVIPRHVILPLQINSYNAANYPTIVVDITEVNGDGRNWHAAGSPTTIAPTLEQGDKTIYFSFTQGVTPATRIGYDYEVTIFAASAQTQAYLSNVASDSSNYYTADANYIESYNINNEPLDTEAAVSIHGDFVAPEPSSLALLSLGGLALARRRR